MLEHAVVNHMETAHSKVINPLTRITEGHGLEAILLDWYRYIDEIGGIVAKFPIIIALPEGIHGLHNICVSVEEFSPGEKRKTRAIKEPRDVRLLADGQACEPSTCSISITKDWLTSGAEIQPTRPNSQGKLMAVALDGDEDVEKIHVYIHHPHGVVPTDWYQFSIVIWARAKNYTGNVTIKNLIC